MRIGIRADGGTIIGMGHIIRSLALANKLKENGHEVFFICREDSFSDKYTNGIKLLGVSGFKVVTIKEKELKKEIKNIEADCILTDSYDVDEEYFDIIKAKFLVSGCIYDRDCKNISKFNVDFFVNPDLYATKEDYITNDNTKKLIGSKYIILRKEFLEFGNNQFKVAPIVKNIMVTLGGSNSYSYINKILENIINLEQYNFFIILGIGISNYHKESLIKVYGKYKNINIFYNVNDIWNIMLKCDLAISACGTTLYELMYLGIPTIGIVTAENQIVMGEYLTNNNIISVCKVNCIEESILELNFSKRREMNNIYKKIVDGKGIDRITQTIESLYNKKTLEDNNEKSNYNSSKNGF